MIAKEFKPFYTWPNKAFPFRVYFDSPELKIFIIENIVHNYEWLSAYRHKINERHFFFVMLGWHHDEHFAKHYEQIFEHLKLDKKQFFFMCNAPDEIRNLQTHGFNCELINQNCWIDENLMKIIDTPKKYNAILISRRAAFKRLHLASEVPNLALVSGGRNYNSNARIEIPPHVFDNDKLLNRTQLCLKINEALCGLILSEKEGACFSSSEYLLCGIPVVSTPSLGGRDVWYNKKNSLICKPSSSSVAECVNTISHDKRNPQEIRNMHIEQANKYREKFIHKLQTLFESRHIDIDPKRYFSATFIDRMRISQVPNFENYLC